MLNFRGFWGVWYWILAGGLAMRFSHGGVYEGVLCFSGLQFYGAMWQKCIPLHNFGGFRAGVRVHICSRAKIILDFARYVC